MFHLVVYAFACIGIVLLLAIGAAVAWYIALVVHVNRRLQVPSRADRIGGWTVPEDEGWAEEVGWVEDDEYGGEADASLVPPMSIHLESPRRPMELLPVEKDAVEWLKRHGFQPCGMFVIEELGFEVMVTLTSPDRRVVAAVRRPSNGDESYVEFCFDLGDGRRGGVSNPPPETVRLSHDAVGKHFDGSLAEDLDSLLTRMWDACQRLLEEHQVRPIDPERVDAFYEEAHWNEMQYYIQRGGLSAEEIRAVLSAQGNEPTAEEIDQVQAEWQEAIEFHLIDFSSRGLEYYYEGGDVLIVYDGSVASYLMDRMRNFLADVPLDDGLRESQILESLKELEALLQRFSPRDAVARFRALLPPSARYRLIDQINTPVEADLYLLPSFPR